jgi:hypothetical protein
MLVEMTTRAGKHNTLLTGICLTLILFGVATAWAIVWIMTGLED